MAIAFDAASHSDGDARTTLTQAHTVTGANPVLIVFAAVQVDTTWTTATYNGVPMTQVFKRRNQSNNQWLYGFILVGPATGTHNIVISDGNSRNWNGCSAMSYTGCKQSSQPDSFNSTSSTGSGSQTVATTVVDANCWLVFSSASWDADPTSVASGVIRTQLGGGGTGADSNGTVSTGSQSAGFGWGASDNHALGIMSLSPLTAVDVTVSASVLSASFSTPAATIVAVQNITVAPSVLSASFSLPAASVTGGATVTPAALAATFSLPAVEVQTPDTMVSPSVLSLTASLPTVSIITDQVIAVAAQSATFSIPAPTVSVVSHITIAPSPLTLVFTLLAPTRTGGLWTNDPKNAASWGNQAKSSASWVNQDKSAI